MKTAARLAIVVVLALLLQAESTAQSRFGKVVQAKFGVGAGVNWSGLRDVQIGSITIDYEAQQGWHAGAFVDIGFLFLGARPGVYYVNAGKVFSQGFIEGNASVDFDLTYISVPVDLKLGIPLPIIMPYIFVGPEFKFNLVSDDKGPIASRLESTVVAGNAGIGVGVTLGRVQLYPEIRFGWGISDTLTGTTIEIDGEEYTFGSHAENSYLIRLGVGF